MLRVVATTGKQDAEVAEAYTLVENNAIKKYKKKKKKWTILGHPRAQYRYGGNPKQENRSKRRYRNHEGPSNIMSNR